MFTKSLLMSLLLAGTAIKGCEACGSCVEPRHAGDEGNSSARSLIHDAIKALGGRQSLHNLHGVTYESPEILRNISYSFSDTMAQRIDRNYQLSDYFFFGTPSIPPVQFSLVMKSGPEGYACYTEGNDFVFVPGNVTIGYTDSALADYLLFQAPKMSPRLLLDIERHRLQSVNVDINGVPFPAVHDKDLDLTVAFNPETKLPFVFRSFEDHAIFGRTENDLRLFNYKEVDGIMFPTQRLVVQNSTSVLEQTTFAKVIPNPKFPDDFFDGLDEDKSATPRVPPSKIDGYSHAEIGEYWTNALWGGPYAGTYDNLTSETLGEDLPNAHRLLVENNPVVEHLVLDFEDGVIVYEAPPHQTDLVIRWVKENLKKPITHIFPTHHHHDHNYDIHKYVELGAKIIAPEVGAPYWKQIPGAEIITFTEEEPFIYSDDTMQARFIWHSEAPHAADWSYSIVKTKCPTANSTMLAYEADAFSTYPFRHAACIWMAESSCVGRYESQYHCCSNTWKTCSTVLSS